MVSHAIIQGYSLEVLSFFFSFLKPKRSFNNYLRGHEEVFSTLAGTPSEKLRVEIFRIIKIS